MECCQNPHKILNARLTRTQSILYIAMGMIILVFQVLLFRYTLKFRIAGLILAIIQIIIGYLMLVLGLRNFSPEQSIFMYPPLDSNEEEPNNNQTHVSIVMDRSVGNDQRNKSERGELPTYEQAMAEVEGQNANLSIMNNQIQGQEQRQTTET